MATAQQWIVKCLGWIRDIKKGEKNYTVQEDHLAMETAGLCFFDGSKPSGSVCAELRSGPALAIPFSKDHHNIPKSSTNASHLVQFSLAKLPQRTVAFTKHGAFGSVLSVNHRPVSNSLWLISYGRKEIYGRVRTDQIRPSISPGSFIQMH